MLQRFVETQHPVFTSVSAPCREFWNETSTKRPYLSQAESSNTELSVRTIPSANHLSNYGAVSSWSGQPSPNEAELTPGEVHDKRRVREYGKSEECEFT